MSVPLFTPEIIEALDRLGRELMRRLQFDQEESQDLLILRDPASAAFPKDTALSRLKSEVVRSFAVNRPDREAC